MIADTTFLSDLLKERRRGVKGAASALLEAQRVHVVRTTIISATELALMFPTSAAAFEWLRHWKIYRLHDGVAAAAADVDRALMRDGQRLGENDTWIAGFAAYYRQPVISHDKAFDRAPGVRRIVHSRD